MIPGTSCQATIVLSLRDKSHSPIERLTIILALMGGPPQAPGFHPYHKRCFSSIRRFSDLCIKTRSRDSDS